MSSGVDLRELMRRKAQEKAAKAEQMKKALQTSKNKEQLLAMLRQKVAANEPVRSKTKGSASAKSGEPAPGPMMPPPPPKPSSSSGGGGGGAMAPPPPKKSVVVQMSTITSSTAAGGGGGAAGPMAPPSAKPKPVAAPMAPPPPPVTAAPTGLVGLAGDYGSDDDDDDEEEEESGPAGGAAPSSLPAGFFDDDVAPMAPAPATKTAAAEEEEEEEESGPSSAADASALPTGFFDDPEADAVAHNVDYRAKQEQDLKKEWNEFQKFAASVVNEEKDEEAAETDVLEDNDERSNLEHMYYNARLAGLMAESVKAKAKRGRQQQEEEEKGGGLLVGADVSIPVADEVPTLPATGDTAASEISSMLLAKKKKRKKAEAEVFEKDYVPLDPLDWRAKLIN